MASDDAETEVATQLVDGVNLVVTHLHENGEPPAKRMKLDEDLAINPEQSVKV